MRTIPSTIDTGIPELDLVWSAYAAKILATPGVIIPDSEEDMNWHAFLGHSADMQGFRAAEFSGADPYLGAALFRSLRDRGIGVRELGGLWEIAAIREHLSRPRIAAPLSATYTILRQHGGDPGGSLAEAFETFPYRKQHRTVRALLQNSAALKANDFSFRGWLEYECRLMGVEYPPADFRAQIVAGTRQIWVEFALRERLEQAFYLVGPAISPYMLCDWQLWLWNMGQTAVFASFKLDSFHQEFAAKYGRGHMPADEAGFAGWWLTRYPDLPPRLANKCIWLGRENRLLPVATKSN